MCFGKKSSAQPQQQAAPPPVAPPPNAVADTSNAQQKQVQAMNATQGMADPGTFGAELGGGAPTMIGGMA